MGGTHIYFPNPFALTKVDGFIIEDAKREGYALEVHYNAVIPHFSSVKKVNTEMGLFNRRP